MTTEINEDALRQFADDIGPEITELIGTFIIDIQTRMNELSGIDDGLELSDFAIHAHSLKGLTQACGMSGISTIAYELEKACRQGNREQASLHVASISRNIDGAIEAVTRFIDKLEQV